MAVLETRTLAASRRTAGTRTEATDFAKPAGLREWRAKLDSPDWDDAGLAGQEITFGLECQEADGTWRVASFAITKVGLRDRTALPGFAFKPRDWPQNRWRMFVQPAATLRVGLTLEARD